MENICIYIQLPGYIRQWFIHEQGGSIPVKLMKGCMESRIIEFFMEKPPVGFVPQKPQPDAVPIILPSTKFKSPESCNYLAPSAYEALVECIVNRFNIQLWQDLHRFGYIGRRMDKLIFAWMEKNGIEDDGKNWDAIAKCYQRRRETYLKNQRSAKCRENKKNTKIQ